jgi:hypothetical protein
MIGKTLSGTTMILACTALATSAAAADPPTVGPVITATPMSPEPTGAAPGVTQPSDLPAPETSTWVNRPLLVTSSLVLVASYVPMASIAYTSDHPADQKNLYYPIVGPWMNLADRQCGQNACANEALTNALLVADGIGQGLGALGVVTSFFLPNKATRNWYLIGDERVHAGPTRVAGGGYGFGASGKF